MNRDRKEYPRVLLLDTLGESTYDGGMERIEDFPTLCRRLIDNPPYFQFAYHPGDTSKGFQEDFDSVCEAVLCCKNLLFVVEEIDLYCTPHFLPLPMQKIIGVGRHREISVWCVSRHPKVIHPYIRSQANRIISFAQSEPAHLKWMAEVMGDDAYAIQKLPQYRAYEWHDGFEVLGTEGSKELDSEETLH